MWNCEFEQCSELLFCGRLSRARIAEIHREQRSLLGGALLQAEKLFVELDFCFVAGVACGSCVEDG